MSDVLARLGVEIDAKGARAGANAVNRALNSMKSRATRVTNRMSRDISKVKSNLLNMKSAMIGLGGGVALAKFAHVIGGVEHSLSAVEAVTQSTKKEMNKLTSTARQLGATTVFSAREAAEGMKFLGMAGFNTTKIVSSMPAMLDLAAAATMDLGQAADITSNIMSAFLMKADEATEVADALAVIASSANTDITQMGDSMKYVGPVAKGMGMSMKDTAAAIGVLAQAGMAGSMAGTSLRKVILELNAPSSKSKKIFKSYGIELSEVSTRTNKLSEALARMKSAGITPEEITTMFGMRGGPGAIMLVEMVELLDRFENKMIDVKGEANRMATTMSDNLFGAGKALISAFEELILQTGDKGLGGAFRALVDNATGVLRVWGGMADPLDESTEQFKDLARSIEGVSAAVGVLVAGGALVGVAKNVAAIGVALANPWVSIPLGLAAAIGAVVAYRDEIRLMIDPIARQRVEWEKQNIAVKKMLKSLTPLVGQYDDLAKAENRTAEEEKSLLNLTNRLKETYPEFASALDGTAKSARELNESLRELEVGQQLVDAGRALTNLRNEYGARKLSKKEGDWFLTIWDPSRTDEIKKELDNALLLYQNAQKALAMPGAKPTTGLENGFIGPLWPGKKKTEDGDGDGDGVAGIGGLTPYKDMLAEIESLERDSAMTRSMIGKDGMDARIQQVQNETRRKVYEIQEMIAETQRIEGASETQKTEAATRLWNVLFRTEKQGLDSIAGIRDDFRAKQKQKDDREAERLKAKFEWQVESYKQNFDPAFRRDTQVGRLNEVRGELSPKAVVYAESSIDRQFNQANRQMMMEIGNWQDGMTVATEDYLDVAQNSAQTFYEAWSTAIRGTEDIFNNFLMTGEFNLKSFGNMFRQIAAQWMSKQITSSLFGGGGDFVGNILGGLGKVFGGGRASGGPVSAGKIYEVNEHGRGELFAPNTGGTVVPLGDPSSSKFKDFAQSRRSESKQSGSVFHVSLVQNFQDGKQRPGNRTNRSDKQKLRELARALQQSGVMA